MGRSLQNLTIEELELVKNPNLTCTLVAEKIGGNRGSVSKWRKGLGIPVTQGCGLGAPRKPTGIRLKCANCGKLKYVVQSYVNQFVYCSKECMYSSDEYRAKLKNVDRGYTQTDWYRAKLRKESTPEFKRYAGRVHRLTAKTYALHESEINPNGYARGLAGVEGAYHLDHKVTIRYGFDNGIPPETLSQKDNLTMLPWKENIQKGKTCLFTSQK